MINKCYELGEQNAYHWGRHRFLCFHCPAGLLHWSSGVRAGSRPQDSRGRPEWRWAPGAATAETRQSSRQQLRKTTTMTLSCGPWLSASSVSGGRSGTGRRQNRIHFDSLCRACEGESTVNVCTDWWQTVRSRGRHESRTAITRGKAINGQSKIRRTIITITITTEIE